MRSGMDRDHRAEYEAIGAAIGVGVTGGPFWGLDLNHRAEYEAIGIAVGVGVPGGPFWGDPSH